MCRVSLGKSGIARRGRFEGLADLAGEAGMEMDLDLHVRSWQVTLGDDRTSGQAAGRKRCRSGTDSSDERSSSRRDESAVSMSTIRAKLSPAAKTQNGGAMMPRGSIGYAASFIGMSGLEIQSVTTSAMEASRSAAVERESQPLNGRVKRARMIKQEEELEQAALDDTVDLIVEDRLHSRSGNVEGKDVLESRVPVSNDHRLAVAG